MWSWLKYTTQRILENLLELVNHSRCISTLGNAQMQNKQTSWCSLEWVEDLLVKYSLICFHPKMALMVRTPKWKRPETILGFMFFTNRLCFLNNIIKLEHRSTHYVHWVQTQFSWLYGCMEQQNMPSRWLQLWFYFDKILILRVDFCLIDI